ncbi:MAG: hypothetical protein NZ693_01175, partial [Thermoflexales bacterium]|nr:hypothetical protein [Thermoflexales bacterium]
QRAPNDAGLRALAFRMGYFTGYAIGQASELLYSARGTTDDWAYGVLGIPAFTFEIGPDWWQSCGGFMPPYTCQDTFWALNREAFLYAAKVARQPYALSHGPTVIAAAVTPSAVVAGQIVTVTAQANDNALGQHPNSFGRPTAQAVAAAEVYLATPPWDGGSPALMSAQDGTFDTPVEPLIGVVDTTGLPAGRHLVFVRAQDANGDWGPVTAAWLTIVEPKLHLPVLRR